MKKIKGIIFDLDGTIGDTLPLCIKAFRHSIEPLTGRSITDAEIIATFGPSEEGTIMALAPDHYDQGVADYLQHYQDFHSMCPAPFEGIINLLDLLKEKGTRIAMVTGKGKHSTAISLSQFGLTSYFELVETGVPGGPRKAEGIQQILEQWADFSQDDVLYIGDAPSDITASRKAGIAIVAAAWAKTAEPELLRKLHPDALFYSVSGLEKWLETRIG
jgi:phosphoglycolate phosphatase-like HAD superfamily hydrolase